MAGGEGEVDLVTATATAAQRSFPAPLVQVVLALPLLCPLVQREKAMGRVRGTGRGGVTESGRAAWMVDFLLCAAKSLAHAHHPSQGYVESIGQLSDD